MRRTQRGAFHMAHTSKQKAVCSSRPLLENVKVFFCCRACLLKKSHIAVWHSVEIKASKGPLIVWLALDPSFFTDNDWTTAVWKGNLVPIPHLHTRALQQFPVEMLLPLLPPHHAHHQHRFHLFSREKEQNRFHSLSKSYSQLQTDRSGAEVIKKRCFVN